jgi:hypothetical protein
MYNFCRSSKFAMSQIIKLEYHKDGGIILSMVYKLYDIFVIHSVENLLDHIIFLKTRYLCHTFC